MTPAAPIGKPTAGPLRGARGFRCLEEGISSAHNSEKSLWGVTWRKSVQKNSPWEKRYMNQLVPVPVRGVNIPY